MSAHRKQGGFFHGLFRKVEPPHPQNNFRAKPCGEIDYDRLYEEVSNKYPKIIARLAE